MSLDDLSSENIDQIAGIMSRFGFTQVKLAKIKEKKAAQNFRDLLLIILVNQGLERVDELIAFHAAEIERLLDEIDETSTVIEELNEDHEAIDGAISHYQNEGVLEIDDAVQGAIHSYEARTGKQDVLKSGNLYGDLLTIQLDIEQEQARLSHAVAQKNVEFEFHSERKQKLEQLKDVLENGTSSEQVSALNVLNEFEQKPLGYARENVPETKMSVHEGAKTNVPEASRSAAEDFSFDFSPKP